ncbi:DUF2071 domain-containing protein [Curtobacterium sp. MCLR17_036]|uniref:YqjF family protein n=1 Tax=Curtobacterium sp. MCLR17_036 TaxID=2175620 RepID=UPI0024DF4CCD|nr:DUF2071 domain-containing protein [Curtobacterium sp. MCLR17_036]WIE64047.1 DUF2071 domain-containing protein [Curtobacterium sp. MCLR17_036]
MTDRARERAAGPLLHRPVTVHAWQDIVFAHWRSDPGALARLVPRGTRPDVVDGSAWVGLSAYVFDETRVPPFPSAGRLGRMTEVTLEVLTVDDQGRHGVTYRTVDTANVPAIVAAHALLGVPYTFAHAGSRRRGDTVAHRSVRHSGRVRHPFRWAHSLHRDRAPDAPRPRGAASVRVHAGDVVDTPLAAELTTRAGIHARYLAQTLFWQRQHAPLTVRSARLDQLEGDLPAAVGLSGLFDREPDSLLVVDGTTVRYSWGGVIR